MKVTVNETLKGTEVICVLTAREALDLLMMGILTGPQVRELREQLEGIREKERKDEVSEVQR